VGNRTLYTYNANGATTQVDYIEINGLNGASEPSHVSYILNRSDVAWEVRDRRWSTSFDTSGNTTRDSWGRVTVSTDAAGNTVSTNYDLLSRVTDSTEEAGTDDIHTMFEYDDDGRTLTRAIKRNPGDTTYQETEYVYDERSRLITLRRPDGDIWNFRYDVNGNRTGWDDPLGTTVTDTYDARNLISYRNIVRGTGIVGTDYESYEFDGLGRLQSCSNYADGELITASAWEYNTQSQPERHDQTICDYQGAHLGTWTTQAEYDATGFNTATIYSNGRRVDHLKDQLDRLSASYDEENAIYIAAYVYGGPRRIVERTLGNGTRTSYTYEASGCGCGGSTQFIERVEHTEISNGRTLWATNRRHDIRGLVTAESRDQEGANGNVFRYDESERLTNTYYGVDLSSTGLDTYGNPANTPSTFGKRTSYPLDPRGNRTSVVEYDDELSPTTIWDAGYSANADTNQYTAADASSFSYDAIEQLTTDNGRSLGFAYDYKGQLITEEADSDNPERRYSYDNQGRRRTEERFYEASYDLGERISFCYGPGINDTCAGSLGDQATEEHVDAGDGTLQHSIYYSFGAGAVGGVSGRAKHPATPAFPVGGHFHGPDRIFELVDPATGGDLFRYRYEDQLGSLIGMADENGAKLLDEVYLDYGRAVERIIAYDGDHDDVNEGSSGGSPPNTTIAITGASFTTDEFKGMQLCVADLNNAAFYAGTVQSNTGTAITVDDPSGYINTAVLTDDLDFVIYDFVDTAVATSGSYHTAGEWTSVSFEENDPGTLDDRTKFTDSGANFASYMVGWLISVNVEEFAYLEITDVDEGGTWVRVNGNASNLAAADDRYWVFAPPHVDPSTGAMKGSYTGGTFEPEYHTSYLWGLYRYQPPMVGYYVDPDGAPALGVYGAQSGTNMAGTYHAGAREYDPSIGRWTTPDPVALPWRNLFHYVRHRPLSKNDPSGLTTWRISESLDSLDNGGSPEDDLGDGAKSLGAETDVETNADESEILEHIKQTGEDDVFVYLGHTWDMDGDGTADTLEEHDGALTSGLIGLAGGGLIGGLAGLATCGNDAVDEDEFDEAADDAKGVIVLLGCKGCGLKDKFKNAKCVICSETDMDKMCASSLMRFMGETLEGLAKGESMTWEKMKDKMNEHLKEKKCTERMVAKGDKCSTTNISKSK
jgi:RHS repeat-associated protein